MKSCLRSGTNHGLAESSYAVCQRHVVPECRHPGEESTLPSDLEEDARAVARTRALGAAQVAEGLWAVGSPRQRAE